MKQIKEEMAMFVRELSKEELQNIYGGSWWETRIIDGEIVFIFHLYD